MLCFSLLSFIASELIFLHSLGLKCCDHYSTKLLTAAVINYKFSQPNANYWQSNLLTACFIVFYNILLVSSILGVYRKLCLAFLTHIANFEIIPEDFLAVQFLRWFKTCIMGNLSRPT